MSNEASKGPGVERDWDEDPQELDAGRLEPTPTSGWTTGDWFDLSLIHISEPTRPY